MIDGSEKRNRQLAFELQNSHVCEKRSKYVVGNLTLERKENNPTVKIMKPVKTHELLIIRCCMKF